MEKVKTSDNKIQATYQYKGKTEISERPENLEEFKKTVKQLFHLSDEQLEKCSITYKNKDEKNANYIMNEEDYQNAKLISEDIIFTIKEEDQEKIKNEIKNQIIETEEENNINNYSQKNFIYNNFKKNVIYKNEEGKTINILDNPSMKVNQLNYIEKGSYDIYVNLFQIILKKELRLYQYPYKVVPEIEEGDILIRKKLFKFGSNKLKTIYGECFIFGDSLYSIKKVEELMNVKVILFLNGRHEYTLEFQKYTNEKIIRKMIF